jgi:PAS domain S-box-containing protein
MNPRQILRVVGGYALIGALYILYSDSLLFALEPPLATAYSIGILKDLGLIVVTSLVLAWLLHRVRHREQERDADLFARHHAVMLLVHRDSGAIVDATPEAARFYGLDRGRLLGMRVADLERSADGAEPVDWSRVLHGIVGTFHCRQLAAGGNVRDVEVHAGPMLRDGEPPMFLIIHDETERLQAATELASAEARWRFALEGAGHGVWEWNVRTNRVFFSHAWKSMLGYADEDIGDSLAEWETRVHPEDLAAARAAIADHFAGRTPFYRSEHRLRCKDGSYRWILDQGKVMTRSADGRPLLVIGTHTDISALRHTQEALRTSEERYFLASQATFNAIWDWDLRADTIWWNDRFFDLFGYSPEETAREHDFWAAHLHPDERGPVRARLAAVLNGTGTTWHECYRFLRADGEYVVVEDRGLISRDARGRALRMVGAMQDISERQRAEQSLRESEARYRALAEQTLVGIYVIAGDRIEYMNPRAAAIFGYGEQEVCGMPLSAFVAEQDRELVAEKVQLRMSGGLPSAAYEFTGLRKDGTTVLVGAHGTAAEIRGRRVVLGVLQDITDKRQTEETIRDYVRRLESAVVGTAAAVSQMVELRDPYTAGHERRVGELSAAIAAEMGLDENVQRGLRVAGAVHDVGKIVVPAEILTKPGRLSKVELELVRTHAQQGYEVLKDVPFPWPVAEVARQHHERLDGSGYPRGLKDGEILLEARILAVADVVESMASHRPYRAGLGIDAALREISENAGRLYDDAAVAACLRLFNEKGYQIPD